MQWLGVLGRIAFLFTLHGVEIRQEGLVGTRKMDSFVTHGRFGGCRRSWAAALEKPAEISGAIRAGPPRILTSIL
jgi:hypothetical protein